MNDSTTKRLIEGGIMVALAYVLSFVTVYKMPNGGSVTAASMIPIIIYALRWGPKAGIFAGTIYGIIQFVLGPKYSMHIISILFDYVVAFGLLGVAGFFKGNIVKEMFGIFVAVFMRFACHVVSGVYVWGIYAPKGVEPLNYAIVYNATYLLPEIIVSMVVFGFLYRPLKKISV